MRVELSAFVENDLEAIADYIALDDSTPNGWRLDGIAPGGTAADLLYYVHLEPKTPAASYRRKLAGLLPPD